MTTELRWPEPLTPEAAFTQLEPKLQSLSEAELDSVNIDLERLTKLMESAMPGLVAWGARISALPEFPIELHAELGIRLRALQHADSMARQALSALPTGRADTVLDHGIARREALRAEAERWVRNGLLASAPQPAGARDRGFLKIANAIEWNAQRLKSAWSAGGAQSEITMSQLDSDLGLATSLRAASAVRVESQARVDRAIEQRARAFTLFLRAYRCTQRALTYLCWESGDLESRLPPLQGRRGARPKRPSPEAVPTN